jgi:uncharacterized metal-binding protein YceD (DUF177 family)
LSAKHISASNEAQAADWKFRQTVLQFARSGYVISGAIETSLLTRTTEDGTEAHDVSGTVTALQVASGGAISGQRTGFTVGVRARLGLTCQSCAALFELPVDSRSVIYVARDAAELASWEDEDFDSLEANEKTSALELVEDELLLAIPYVPRCLKCEATLGGGEPRVFEFN